MTDSPVLALAKDLISRQSVTPEDAGCQQIMIERLEKIGFQVKKLRFGDVDNFWATLGPDTGKTLCFAGHTDVVPAGDEANWQHPPYTARIHNGFLQGRGAADMKGSLAAMVVACERLVADNPNLNNNINNRLAFLITSDEEGIAINGTVKVVEYLQQRNETIDWCIVGEPSSSEKTGDVIKNGRRGSLGLKLTVNGVQGHVAYPQLAKNPIHLASPALAELAATQWDEGNEFFPATSFQISNINGGTGATNVIPGSLEVIANFRFSTELTVDQLQQRTEAILQSHNLDYHIDWHVSGLPFITPPGDLVNATVASIKDSTCIDTELSTAGGTSDGRFIAPMGTQVVELGPVNATIHKVDEQVVASELEQLTDIYQQIMQRLLC